METESARLELEQEVIAEQWRAAQQKASLAQSEASDAFAKLERLQKQKKLLQHRKAYMIRRDLSSDELLQEEDSAEEQRRSGQNVAVPFFEASPGLDFGVWPDVGDLENLDFGGGTVVQESGREPRAL